MKKNCNTIFESCVTYAEFHFRVQICIFGNQYRLLSKRKKNVQCDFKINSIPISFLFFRPTILLRAMQETMKFTCQFQDQREKGLAPF